MASPDPAGIDDRTTPGPRPGSSGLRVGEAAGPPDLGATLPHTPAWEALAADEAGAALTGSGIRPSPRNVDLDEFARSVVETGLVEPEAVRAVLARPGGWGQGEGRSAALARELVSRGELTRYQAAAVLQGKAKGLVIGKYLVQEKLGSGGGGLVFKALHRRMNRVVALKVLPPSITRDPAAVRRFHREAEAAAHLSHPNVVAALDADEFRGVHFLVMELVEGRDLARKVAEDGPPPVAVAVDYALQAARGLCEAHARGIYHRDIKPSNLLLDGSGVVKVSDLGLARMLGGDEVAAAAAGVTVDGAIMGTVDYMPPEQAYNSKLADHRSDVYGLGCSLYFLLAGRVPFPAESLVASLLAHRERPAPAVRDRRPDAPPALDDLVRRMMAKAPEARPQSMEAVIAELTALQPGLPDTPAPPPPPLTTGTPPPPAETPPPAAPPVPAEARHPRASRRALWVSAGVASAAVGFASAALLVGRPGKPGPAATQPSPRRPGVAGPATAAGLTSPRVPEPDPDPAPTGATPETPGPTVAAAATPAPAPELPTPEPTGLVRTLSHGRGMVQAVAVSDDGRLAVSGGNDLSVRCWDLATGQELCHFEHAKPVLAVAVWPDGRRVVSSSYDGTVRVWALESAPGSGPDSGGAAGAGLPRSGRDVLRLRGLDGVVNALAVSADGRWVLTGGEDGAALVWDAATGERVAGVTHPGRVNAVAFTADGRRALSAGVDGRVTVWEAGSGAEVLHLDAGGEVDALAVSADGRRVLAGAGLGAGSLWDLAAPGSPRRLAGGPIDQHRGAAFLGPDGSHALTAYRDGAIVLHDLDRGTGAAVVDDHEAGRLALAVTPDGRHALTSDDDGLVRYWRLPASARPTIPPGPALNPRSGTP